MGSVGCLGQVPRSMASNMENNIRTIPTSKLTSKDIAHQSIHMLQTPISSLLLGVRNTELSFSSQTHLPTIHSNEAIHSGQRDLRLA